MRINAPNSFAGSVLGYCTNVHAGTNLATIKADLDEHAVAVKARVSPTEALGIGLWLPYSAAVQLTEGDAEEKTRRFRDWLTQRGLFCFTLNGFPFGDFHREVVKHAVYEPHWADPRRLDYTRRLSRILAGLLPDDVSEASISTLPLGWPATFCGRPDQYDAQARLAAKQLTDLVHDLARLELDTGKHIHVDLEPEPGCVLDTAPGVVRYFEQHLWGTPDEVSVRGYLGVCHDVCHSAVMFEPQTEAIDTYRKAGLRVGKVQVSSAIEAEFDGKTPEARDAVVTQLRSFAEDRYLHQTVIRDGAGETRFYEDLPVALDQEASERRGTWRVHFHVPVFADSFGSIASTQAEIAACLRLLRQAQNLPALEVETYAWGVLPPSALPADDGDAQLADGIAAELRWVRDRLR